MVAQGATPFEDLLGRSRMASYPHDPGKEGGRYVVLIKLVNSNIKVNISCNGLFFSELLKVQNMPHNKDRLLIDPFSAASTLVFKCREDSFGIIREDGRQASGFTAFRNCEGVFL